MTMATTMELAKPLQALIDARLDTIDRMLMGQIPRADRLSILREVESQIEELLAERDAATITRDDIIEVLRQLDPPEAFVPEEIPDPAIRTPQSFSGKRTFSTNFRQNQAQTLSTGKPSSRAGLISGILGLSTFFSFFILLIIAYVIAVFFSSPELLIAEICAISFVGLGTSLCAIILGIMGRIQGIMPIVGMVKGALSVLLCVVVPIVVLMVM
jgi:hypothetical protein